MTICVQTNVSLQQHNTMAVPAQAQYLIELTSVDQVPDIIDFYQSKQLPVLVIGEGSNTVFTTDYAGLIILNRLRGIDLIEDSNEHVLVNVGAGENWHNFVAYCVEQGWYGLENLALIPGLVGAAPIQNIGAYGVEVKESIVMVQTIDLVSGEVRILSREDCQFAYRESIFKKQSQHKTLITQVSFALTKTPTLMLDYPALKHYLLNQVDNIDQATPTDVFKAVCEIRQSKLPSPNDIPNTGSFFKNPIVSADKHQQLLSKYADLVSFVIADQYKLAAGWLIEKAGWKQRPLNDVCVHKQQALVITNPHRRSGQAVIRYAREIQKDINEKFGVHLEIEPRIY